MNEASQARRNIKALVRELGILILLGGTAQRKRKSTADVLYFTWF